MGIIIVSLIFTNISSQWQSFTNCDIVYDIKEKEGTLYLATNGGIVLFDPLNKEVKVIYTNIEGLPNVVARSIDFDPRGDLWVATDGGICYLLSSEDSFRIYPREKLPLSGIKDILFEGDKLYIASYSGLARINTYGTLNPEDDNIAILNRVTFPPLLSDTIYSLYLFNDTLYIATERGINIVSTQNFLIPQEWDSLTVEDGLPSPSVHSILVGDSFFIVGTDSGLLWKKRETVRVFLTDISFCVEALFLHNDTLYLAGKPENENISGIWKIEFNGEPIPLFPSFAPYENFWKSKGEIIFIDSDNRKWAGFSYAYSGRNPPEHGGRGLVEFQPGGYTIYPLGGLRSNFITSMAQWNEGIWMCSYISRTIPYPVWGVKNGKWFTVGEPYELKFCYFLKTGPDGNLWIGAYSVEYGGLYVVDTNLQVIDFFEVPYPHAVTSLAFTRDGEVVVGVHSAGVFKFPRESPQDITVLDITLVTYTFIEIDYKGRIWVGSENSGCLVINEDTGERIHLSMDDGLPENFVSTLKADGETMWIGTLGGLAEYRDERIQRVFLKNDPLYGTQRIKDIEVAPDGNLWILTEEGVFILIPETGNIIEYFNLSNSPLINLPNNFWVRNTLEILVEKSEIWIGTVHGVSSLIPYLYWSSAEGVSSYIYPNPFIKNGGRERIYITNISDKAEIEFFTISGEKLGINALDFIKRGNIVTIKAKKLKAGLYLVVIKEGKGGKVLKFAVVE